MYIKSLYYNFQFSKILLIQVVLFKNRFPYETKSLKKNFDFLAKIFSLQKQNS